MEEKKMKQMNEMLALSENHQPAWLFDKQDHRIIPFNNFDMIYVLSKKFKS